MKVAYIRTSTESQPIDRQLNALKSVADELHVECISGGAKKRPVFDSILSSLVEGDTLIVYDLDRAFRSSRHALNVAEDLRLRGVHFRVLTLGIDTSTPEGELLYTVMAAAATFERRYLSKRTKEGMAAAKRRGKHIGRPRKNPTGQLSFVGF